MITKMGVGETKVEIGGESKVNGAEEREVQRGGRWRRERRERRLFTKARSALSRMHSSAKRKHQICIFIWICTKLHTLKIGWPR